MWEECINFWWNTWSSFIRIQTNGIESKMEKRIQLLTTHFCTLCVDKTENFIGTRSPMKLQCTHMWCAYASNRQLMRNSIRKRFKVFDRKVRRFRFNRMPNYMQIENFCCITIWFVLFFFSNQLLCHFDLISDTDTHKLLLMWIWF